MSARTKDESKKNTSSNDADEIAVYNAAKEGLLDEVKAAVGEGANANSNKLLVQMAVMGAADGKEELQQAHKDYAKQSAVGQWALNNGGCLLWGFKQEPRSIQFRQMTYNKKMTMLSGPGEVPRGTFHSILMDK